MRSFAFVTLPAALLLTACGSSGGGAVGMTSTSASTDDGKYHPPKNGVAMSESDACAALNTAQSRDNLTLQCSATTEVCPDLLRTQFGTQCLQYDQGSVNGCVAYYAMAATCDDLATAITDCEVSPIANSAPNGCP
jgi:hypothetical protein